MANLGMLYAITDAELQALEQQGSDNIYEYLLNSIEEKYFNTPRACELNKAWQGLHYAFNNGDWLEDDSIPAKVIFAGKFLLDTENYVISLKTPTDVSMIVTYLTALQDWRGVIVNGFNNTEAEDLDLAKDDNLLNFLLDWSEGILPFYQNAQNENLNVIFSVDF